MANLKISYLYRDASNYKQYMDVVIANPENLPPSAIEQSLRGRFAADQVWPDVVHFRPEVLGWPTVFFDDHDETEDDLDLHELEGVEVTEEAVTHEWPESDV